MRLGVFQLHGTNATCKYVVRSQSRSAQSRTRTEIVEVSCPFIVRSVIGKDRFEHEFLCLPVQIVVKVISEKKIDQHRRAFEVIT